MAGRTYGRSTLQGNWAEDRAQAEKPKPAVIAASDAFLPVAKDSFRRPTTYKDHFHGRRAGASRRFGMVTPDTITEARMAYGDGEAVGSRFGAIIKVHGGETEGRWFETTGADYGKEAEPDFAAAAHARREAVPGRPRLQASAAAVLSSSTLGRRGAHSALAPPAGGPAARAEARGTATGGSIGEKYVDMADGPASRATAVQRSWYPSVDPAIAAQNARRTGRLGGPERDASYMSVPLGGAGAGAGVVKAKDAGPGCETAAWRAPRRVATITLSAAEQSRKPGVRIFADDP
ncbi:hypothetical protein FNF29_01651 [Cafeteria roenbergensis]|uniref:Uncharacterized protein n=1 Tax=Cafeteria roenbergensis TaxID=33653 RepID=A0A5A8CRU3_CAFRO|nr:hypothetical protein FNF29_01651 [Cafeteria roenbergensis]|eukprot:KAA0155736.1 hypothetical protein FNF29_01651 [Cafeteria roenbergensis]